MRTPDEQRTHQPDIPVIAAGRRHSVGVRRDGRVLAAGSLDAPECAVSDWRNVVAVATGNVHVARNTGRSHTVGLRADGTAVATGWNGDGQCDVASWNTVVTIAAGGVAPSGCWRTEP